MDPPFSSAGDAPHQRPPLPARPSPSARPTIAITPIDIQTLSFPDGSRDTFPVRTEGSTPSPLTAAAVAEDGDDAISVASSAPNPRPTGDTASLPGGGGSRSGPAWASLLRSRSGVAVPPPPPESLLSLSSSSDGSLAGFEHEFDSLPDRKVSGSMDDDDRLQLWKSKLKHYMILSSAGKPIYSRHGDLELINASMGVIQTIISFYEASRDRLLGFTAGDARFVVLTEGPLYLVAVSRLRESDSQLRAQLDALYMQILSTLTLPTLTRIFANRPSTDLRRPLDGTEPLLSSLADSFTRGSASALLGGLECLRLRKTHRHGIDSVLLSLRSDRLLYGMLVAGGKLVSVVRPRRHSLHPGDLQLVFNMLFESGGIKAGGGENWIPLCLPSFNNQGYLYMYVSFFDGADGEQATASSAQSERETVAMILISADKESFYSLKQMRDDVAGQLSKTGSLAIVLAAVRAGRPRVQDVAPGSQISHFLYKSRSNVQFCMPSLSPGFSGLLPRRRLMTVYHQLHAAVHERHHQVKVTHCVSEGATSLGWITPLFELYCIGGPHTSRAAMTQGADQIVQWAKREEERLFIIGGGVF